MEKVKNYLMIADAADFLGISQNTLRSWAESGKIHVRRNPANGYRLFKQNDLERFLLKLEGGKTVPRRKKSPK